MPPSEDQSYSGPQLDPKDTARQGYIRLLKERAEALDTQIPKQRRTMMYAELIAEGYLIGATITDQEGFPNKNRITGITTKGRLFLQELEEQERSRSFTGRLKSGWPQFSGLIGVFIGWLLSSWHPFAQPRDGAASQQQKASAQTPKATPAPATPAQQTTPKP